MKKFQISDMKTLVEYIRESLESNPFKNKNRNFSSSAVKRVKDALSDLSEKYEFESKTNYIRVILDGRSIMSIVIDANEFAPELNVFSKLDNSSTLDKSERSYKTGGVDVESFDKSVQFVHDALELWEQQSHKVTAEEISDLLKKIMEK